MVSTKKRADHDVIHIRPSVGTKAKLEWLASRDKRTMTSFLEVLIDKLYEEAGGPPIEPEKKD